MDEALKAEIKALQVARPGWLTNVRAQDLPTADQRQVAEKLDELISTLTVLMNRVPDADGVQNEAKHPVADVNQ